MKSVVIIIVLCVLVIGYAIWQKPMEATKEITPTPVAKVIISDGKPKQMDVVLPQAINSSVGKPNSEPKPHFTSAKVRYTNVFVSGTKTVIITTTNQMSPETKKLKQDELDQATLKAAQESNPDGKVYVRYAELQKQAKSIVRGVTTTDQILQLFGDPSHQLVTIEKLTNYIYSPHPYRYFTYSDDHFAVLKISFDQSGKVKNWWFDGRPEISRENGLHQR